MTDLDRRKALFMMGGASAAAGLMVTKTAKAAAKDEDFSTPPHKPSKNFMSDNTAPIDPAVLKAMMAANHDYTAPYSNDDYSARLEQALSKKFNTRLRVFPMATGTAANALALSALMRPWGSVICDQEAHIDNDEGGAPEFYTGGKIVTLPSEDGKIIPEKLREALLHNRAKGVLSPPIQVLFLTQQTEMGTHYTKQELKDLVKMAHDFGLLVHLDGARIGNAVAAMKCDIKELTSEIGVDSFVFGMAKAGAMAVELLIVFENERTKDAIKSLPHLRKRSGHVWSKGRFLAVQGLAMLEEDRWLKNSRHANEMMKQLFAGLKKVEKSGKVPLYVPENVAGNELFMVSSSDTLDRLQKQGFVFYRSPVRESLKEKVKHIHHPESFRFVTSFYTQSGDVAEVLKAFAG